MYNCFGFISNVTDMVMEREKGGGKSLKGKKKIGVEERNKNR